MRKSQFVASVKGLSVVIAGHAMTAEPKAFKVQPGATGGSMGWYLNGKMPLVAGKPVTVVINGQSHVAQYRGPGNPFSTGNMGWNLSGKQAVALPDGSAVEVQIGMNLTIVGSKERAPQDGEAVTVQVGCNLTIRHSKECQDEGELGTAPAQPAKSQVKAPKAQPVPTPAAQKAQPTSTPAAQVSAAAQTALDELFS